MTDFLRMTFSFRGIARSSDKVGGPPLPYPEEENQMTQMTLEKALELNGMSQEEGSTITPPQKKFLLESTQDLLNRNGKEWMLASQVRLKAELEMVFNEI